MAKKISFKPDVKVALMVDILRKENIEHVRVKYPHKDYIVVKNVDKDAARRICGDDNISRIKNARHFETISLVHINNYFEPKFTCKCRHCGKTFEHRVKGAVWCSDNCKREFRKAKKQ